MFKSKSVSTVGTKRGNVMNFIFWNRDAPSIEADSYKLGSIPLIAARYTTVPQPDSFHIVERT